MLKFYYMCRLCCSLEQWFSWPSVWTVWPACSFWKYVMVIKCRHSGNSPVLSHRQKSPLLFLIVGLKKEKKIKSVLAPGIFTKTFWRNVLIFWVSSGEKQILKLKGMKNIFRKSRWINGSSTALQLVSNAIASTYNNNYNKKKHNKM